MTERLDFLLERACPQCGKRALLDHLSQYFEERTYWRKRLLDAYMLRICLKCGWKWKEKPNCEP